MKVIERTTDAVRKLLYAARFSHSFIVMLMVLSAVLLTTCRKEDKGDELKEISVRNMLDEVSADSLEAYVAWLQNMGTRFTLADNHRSVAVRIRDRFRRMGYENARLDSFFLTTSFKNVQYNKWQYNVTAVLEGIEHPDSVCILGSHFDDYSGNSDLFKIAPGAHDNASGTAATLEVARVLKEKNFKPSRSIMFIAFAAEELGLFGSLNFVSKPGIYMNKISFMLNNDMIAYEPDRDPESWKVNIMNYKNSLDLRKYAEHVASKYVGMSYFTDNTMSKYSDSYSFYQRGYKAVFFYSGREDPYYHSSMDLITNCNFDYTRNIVRICCGMLADYNYTE